MRTRTRGWRWRRNPLRRRSDAVEAWTVLAVAFLLCVGAPLAGVFAGRWAHDGARAQAAAQRAERHHVRAVLVENAPASVPNPGGRQPTYEVRVRWHEPGGGQRSGVAQVRAGTRRGDRADVWVDARGRGVDPPLGDTAVWQRTLTTGASTAGGVVVIVLVAHFAVRRVATRRRLAEWENNWARTGPEWTRRTA